MEFVLNPDLYIYLGLILILLELIIGVDTGLDLFFIGLNFLISAFVQRFTGYPYSALISLFVLSFIYIFLGREFIKQRTSVMTHNTNIDNLIGKTGRIIKLNDDKKSGIVKVNSEKWRFESDNDLTEGNDVIIKSVEGVTLKVSKK
ncbi:MAG: hypothetical protein KatS3mg090_0868 [Patescibacteria group bacterium]|nr:MAG: hypothetical protein KatS3mg090_0868 [Patescibacteria group bacterium]